MILGFYFLSFDPYKRLSLVCLYEFIWFSGIASSGFQDGGEAIIYMVFGGLIELCSVSCMEYDLHTYNGKTVFCCDSSSADGSCHDNGY